MFPVHPGMFAPPFQVPHMPGRPPSKRVLKILTDILLDSPVSATELEEVLAHSEAPENLPPFGESLVILTTMKLLERQHSRSRRVIQSDYGILCIRLLVVCVQVAVLVEAQMLPNYMKELSQNKLDPALRLNRAVASALHNRVLAANRGRASNAFVPLITVPGFSTENARLVLDYLHLERDRFLTARISKSEEWNGWLGLFYVLWSRLANGGSPMLTNVGIALQDVLCRFGVVRLETRDEESMLDLMALSISVNLSLNGMNDPTSLLVDDADRHQATQAYVQRLTSSTPLLNFSLVLFDWNVHCSDFDRSGDMLAFFRATYVRLWATLDTAKESWPLTFEKITCAVKYFDRLVGYSGLFIEGAGPGGVPQKLKDSLANLLWHNDIVSLFARMLTVHLSDSLDALKPAEKESINETWEGVFENVDHLVSMVLKHCPPDSQVLSNSYPDWLKAAQLFHELRYNYTGSKFNRDHLSTCHREWMKLGSSLFGSQMTDEPRGCLNPRCAHPIPLCGVQFSCGRCFSATYCGHSCQRAHWVRDAFDRSHSDLCAEPRSSFNALDDNLTVVPHTVKP